MQTLKITAAALTLSLLAAPPLTVPAATALTGS